MYDVHLWLIGKHVVDFLLMLIELFLLDVTSEALNKLKIDVFTPTGSQSMYISWKSMESPGI